MTAQDDKAFLPAAQLVKEGQTDALKFELTSCIDCKTVEYHLSETIVVQIDVAKRLPHAEVMTTTEIVIHRDIATMGEKHVERDDEEGHTQIDKPEVQILERPHQRPMHPHRTTGTALPFLMFQPLHYFSLFSIPYFTFPSI